MRTAIHKGETECDDLGEAFREKEKGEEDVEASETDGEVGGDGKPRRVEGEAHGGGDDGEDDDVIEQRVAHQLVACLPQRIGGAEAEEAVVTRPLNLLRLGLRLPIAVELDVVGGGSSCCGWCGLGRTHRGRWVGGPRIACVCKLREDDGDEQVHQQVLADDHRCDEEDAHPRAEDRSRVAHGIDPFAGEQDEHCGHRGADVVEMVVRLLEQTSLADAGGARLKGVASARVVHAAEELHGESRHAEQSRRAVRGGAERWCERGWC